METVAILAAIAPAFVGLLTVAIVTLAAFKLPQIDIDAADHPRLMHVYRLSALYSALLAVAISVSGWMSDLHPLDTAVLSVASGAIGFIFFSSIYTDHLYRKVSKWVIRAAMIPVLSVGLIKLYALENQTYWVIYLASILVFVAVLFLVHRIGASDSRVMMLLAAAALPALGYQLSQVLILSASLLLLAYAAVSSIRQKKTKVSVPMVPYMTFPFIALALWHATFQ